MAKYVQQQFDWSTSPEESRSSEAFEQVSIRSAVPVTPDSHADEIGGQGHGFSAKRVTASDFALCFAALLQVEPDAHFDNHKIAEFAREVFGHSAGHAREAYDAAEAGMNIYIQRVNPVLTDFTEASRMLLALQERMPRQTRRDDTQIELQQFSTPPSLALLVVKTAGLCAGMSVLEPSAGTGNIANLARLCGATVEANEIDVRRRTFLELQEFPTTAFDAERLDNLLPDGRLYDAIVMNPPFSATGGRVRGHSTEFGARHIEQALLRLKSGGRLVAIVGRGMALDRPKFRSWWADIEGRYRVRANVGLDGSIYARFGTTFDHQIIVIDHDGATVSESAIITGSGFSLEEAYERLKELSGEDIGGRILKRHSPNSAHSDSDNLGSGGTDAGGSGHRADSKCVGRWCGRRGSPTQCDGDDGSMDDVEPPGVERAGRPDANHDATIGAREEPDPVGPHRDSDLGSQIAGGDAGSPGNGVARNKSSANLPALRIEEGTVFAEYRVQRAVACDTQAHPANVVESTAMASVEPPDVTYLNHLPAEVIVEGRISDLQLEDVIYAGQATEYLLPDGARKGHWNGDGTGIGKGREIYAFIYDQHQQGRCKHVHVSASHQLCADAERDRDAVGVPLRIVHQALFKPATPILAESGIVFTTYTMLSTDFDGERQRFKQLTEWLGEDFDGVIAFDEAHLMKNAAATPHGGKATVDEGTLRGNMGIALQRMFPMARVRYFSATGASEARHMAPYERLGLWGDGAPFADFSAFLVAMERGGVAAMEMLCRDLKSVGTYLSRTISYGPTRRPDGTIVPESAVEYEPLLHRITEAEREQYNTIADLWSELLLAFEMAEGNACQKRNGGRYA